jgi:hypothetical protein
MAVRGRPDHAALASRPARPGRLRAISEEASTHLMSREPCVGILRVDRVPGDRSTSAVAEPYGDCLTHAGGHTSWEQWRIVEIEQLTKDRDR